MNQPTLCSHRLIGLVSCLGITLLLGCSEPTVDCGEPRPAPDIALPLLTGGETRTLAALRGKVVYVDFWGSWCLPCRESLPFLNRIRNSQSRDDFEVFAINLDELAGDATRFLADYPVDYPVLADPGHTTLADYGVEVVPSSFLIDRQGRICTFHVGFKPAQKARIREEIRALLVREAEKS
ncbi:MAG: TlpA disulfide reductase family protein [Gammaproteobacteria bacterium]|nr:TlpA disulfide reductase family protein [Gammaproteobacteria bacterium]